MTPARIESLAEHLYEHDRLEEGFTGPPWALTATERQQQYRARIEAIAALPDDAQDAECPRLPAEMTPAIAKVLGLMNFRTGPVALVFRAAGHAIKPRCEDEQAFVLFRFLHLAIRHGDGWHDAASADIDAAVAAAKARKEAAS